MKKLYLSLSVCFLLASAACKKVDGVAGKTTISGKWNIVSDSTHVGAGIINNLVVYQGKAGDYFDFRSDGMIYTKEGATYDTLNYQVISDTKILIPKFDAVLNGEAQTSTITAFDAHTLNIAAPEIFTPGGVFGRSVKLSR